MSRITGISTVVTRACTMAVTTTRTRIMVRSTLTTTACRTPTPTSAVAFFTLGVKKAHDNLSKKKQRHRRPRIPSALGYRFGHGYTILRKHNLFRLKQSLHFYYYRRDRSRVISFKRASGLISRLGQLRKCNCQDILKEHYQPKTMFELKKVVRKECRRLQKLYPPYVAAKGVAV